jgi:nitronate monooxygenase
LALLPQVVDAVRAPVIAAGGIADARGMLAALALGAQAARIGTAFLACEQSDAPTAHREELLSDAAKETALSRAITGRLARGLRNRLMRPLSDSKLVHGIVSQGGH